MDLRDIGATLPPGFKFCPNDEELVYHYLWKKIANEEDLLKGTTLLEIDLHSCEPWELPGETEKENQLFKCWCSTRFGKISLYKFKNDKEEVAKLNSTEWYFFSFRERKYTTGYRVNRATKSGYWKATGKDRNVVDPRSGGSVVGMRKSLVFYKNKAPNGIKTGWVMHEFRLDRPHLPPKEDWVLCRVFYKAKSEESSTLQNGFDTIGGDGGGTVATSSHYLASLSPPPTHHHQTTSFSQSSPHHNQNPNPSNINLPLQSPPNPSSFHVSRVINEAPIHEMFINSRSEEDPYGYLFGVNVEDSRTFFEY